MGLRENFEVKRSTITGYMDVELDYKSTDFPGNDGANCTGQVLLWFMGLAGQLSSGTGLNKPLLSTSDMATTLHFDGLNNGQTKILKELADSYEPVKQQANAALVKKLTPWKGSYKLYIIANNKGEGHAIGGYFPWTGSNQFYDPNLIVGPCKSTDGLYQILALWPDLYYGVTCTTTGGRTDWAIEDIYVFSDPKKIYDKLIYKI